MPVAAWSDARTHSHVMPKAESHVAFAEFRGSKRLDPTPGEDQPRSDAAGDDQSNPRQWEEFEHQTGFEPAPLSLGNRPGHDDKSPRGPSRGSLGIAMHSPPPT